MEAYNNGIRIDDQYAVLRHSSGAGEPLATPPGDGPGLAPGTPVELVDRWIEVWDYVGGARFRGFMAEDLSGARSMFVFFDESHTGRDLKQG